MVAAMQATGIHEAIAGVQDLIRYTNGTQVIDVANLVDQVKLFFKALTVIIVEVNYQALTIAWKAFVVTKWIVKLLRQTMLVILKKCF